MSNATPMSRPVEVDTRLAELSERAQRHWSTIRLAVARMERDAARGREASQSDLMDERDAKASLEAIAAEQAPLAAEYAASPWPRWFPCFSHEGHIHSTTSCSTLRATSRMGWLTECSGRDAASMVLEYGTDVCTVCVPNAPVLPKPAYGSKAAQEREAARAKRAARSAEIAAKKAAQQLVAPIKGMSGSTVRTLTDLRFELNHTMPYALGFARTEGLREGLKADADAAYARIVEAYQLKLGDEAAAALLAKAEKKLRREWRR